MRPSRQVDEGGEDVFYNNGMNLLSAIGKKFIIVLDALPGTHLANIKIIEF